MSDIKTEAKHIGLCYRCQRRVDSIEKNFNMRCECGDHERAVCCCYAFVPIKPIVMEKIKGDVRPAFGPSIISARMVATSEADCDLKLKTINKRNGKGVIYWIPKIKI